MINEVINIDLFCGKFDIQRSYLEANLFILKSLIIYEPNFQSDCWGLGHVYRVSYSAKHSISCFHLESELKGRFMSCVCTVYLELRWGLPLKCFHCDFDCFDVCSNSDESG